MIDATSESPVDSVPKIERGAKPHDERVKLSERLVECIERYRRGRFIKHQLWVPRGTGKTFVMLKAFAFAICQGLVRIVTSLAAERSAALAGNHLNALIPFPVEKMSYLNH